MPTEMTPERWRATSEYLQTVFGRPDAQLATLMERAVAAGIPDIAVSSDVGRLLTLLARVSAPGGARIAVEVGTLAGYSAIWLARGLSPGGRLITIELEPRHAEFARREFARAGVADRIEVRIGAALEVLPRLVAQLGPSSIELAFLDAVKSEYPDYARLLKPALRPGGLLIADNALGSGDWWIDDTAPSADREGADALNRAVAADPDFDAACIPMRQGILVACRR